MASEPRGSIPSRCLRLTFPLDFCQWRAMAWSMRPYKQSSTLCMHCTVSNKLLPRQPGSAVPFDVAHSKYLAPGVLGGSSGTLFLFLEPSWIEIFLLSCTSPLHQRHVCFQIPRCAGVLATLCDVIYLFFVALVQQRKPHLVNPNYCPFFETDFRGENYLC